MMHPQEHGAPKAKADLRALLGEDHARLDRLFEELLAAFRAGAREEAAALWTTFDAGLLAHMALEEQRLLPEFAKVDAAEAEALAAEHAKLRDALTELGVGVDLHLTNAAAVERLVATLREHARREDALMYRWASANLQDEEQTSIRAQLLAAARRLAS